MIITPDDEEHLTAYLAGQEAFIKDEEHRPCARCKRPTKKQFTYCYRCNNYVRVKAKIAKEIA